METPQSQFPLPVTDVLRGALKEWHKMSEIDSRFSQFYLYRRLQRRMPGNAKLAVNQFLNEGIKLLQTSYEKEAQFLQARYLDEQPMHRIVNQMNLSESSLYILQREALQRLTETILTAEQEATAAQKTVMLERLGGQSCGELVGLEEQLARLQSLVTNPGPPWIIAVEGMGGIGKTTLVNALLHSLIEGGQVDDIGWVSAQRERFTFMGKLERDLRPAMTAAQLTEALAKQLLPGSAPERQTNALRTRLKELPHVVVIDNLETVPDVESLLPTLQTWANPSKFVLTARESLFGVPQLYHFKVDELSLAHALQLIRQEAALCGLPVLAAGKESELQPIYETVGGNPLALRLVVGQTHVYGLQSILYDLRRARSPTAANLYTYIYQKAWAKLDPLGRQALLVMPLASPLGDELEYLAEVGDLDIDELRMALNQLVMLNLVDARGGLNDRRYSIHGLTRTFLLEQVAKWM
ncbi:MAG: ATP-binding protein [Caldilineaceae bacterium]